ncbi:MAG: hypothetical protein WDN06_10080 [Asticcacaulis sp.]
MSPRPSVNFILFDSATRLIPMIFAVVIFVAGALLLGSIITPIDPEAMPFVQRWLPLGVRSKSRTPPARSSPY